MFYWLSTYSRASLSFAGIVIAGLVVWLAVNSTGNLAISQLQQTAQARLALYESTLRAAVDRYRYLPYVVARNHEIVDVVTGNGTVDIANQYLQKVNQRSGAAALYVIDRSGNTVAASNWNTPDSFVGQNYSFRPYFTEAFAGQEGFFYGIGVTTGRSGLFISHPIAKSGEIVGVVAVKLELDELERNWQDGGETVFVSDADGVIMLTSRGDWKYRTIRPLTETDRERILRNRQYSGQELRSLNIDENPSGEDGLLEIGNERFLFDIKPISGSEWNLFYLTPMDYVAERRTSAMLITLIGSGLIILIVLFLRERELKLASQRKSMEFARIQALNTRLEQEITERRKTEAELRGTQDELVQAGKLAALGQMSAAIAHEINQPIAAIRTFCASAKLMLERGKSENLGPNIEQISALTERMGSITGQLKTFSRKSTGVLEPVNIRAALDNVIQLLSSQLHNEGCVLEQSDFAGDLIVHADLVRIEQVFVNIIRNALDAMASIDDKDPKAKKRIIIDLSGTRDQATIRISDTGPGIGEETLGLLFDPFFTTKDPGQGVGLGLSVTYGIVRDFGGSIRAYNRAGGGACFEIQLPLMRGTQK
ncbi:C4-dicarboxylate ABC transporter [Thalassospira xiamenensis]|uniref:sensor histidine kinase n=1 Tax=Thalassospira xiamenensis TaxID=220697 RepID=UPI000DEDE8C7|nr:cache domain-containing protein [Thalassospira xiamenensis]RCK35214.1 C4-dicarboxylate ABC transporter [Thalassospira xiamenensis]